jgi:predicted nucleic acid-binding protein
VSGSLAYVDASAYLKLLFVEQESATFESVITEWPTLVSSQVLDVEMHRAAYREGVPQADCQVLIDAVELVPLSDAIVRHARRMGQRNVRALDAIHLATAASLGVDLGVLFAYDTRMLNGALLEGLPGWAPRPSL